MPVTCRLCFSTVRYQISGSDPLLCRFPLPLLSLPPSLSLSFLSLSLSLSLSLPTATAKPTKKVVQEEDDDLRELAAWAS